eukprot:3381584-Rhodomonas_salina.1
MAGAFRVVILYHGWGDVDAHNRVVIHRPSHKYPRTRGTGVPGYTVNRTTPLCRPGVRTCLLLGFQFV